MLLCRTFLFTIIALLGVLSGAAAASVTPEHRAPHIAVNLVAERDAITANAPFYLGIHFTLEKGWHVYWQNPGDSGEPPRVTWELADVDATGELLWPPPHRIKMGPLVNYGYEGDVLLAQAFTLRGAPTNRSVEVGAQVRWLVCREECIPGKATLGLTVPISASPGNLTTWAKQFESLRAAQPRAQLAVITHEDAQHVVVETEWSGPATSASPGTVEFFPVDENWIEPSAPQQLTRRLNQLALRLQKSGNAEKSLVGRKALLVVTTEQEKQSALLTLSASPNVSAKTMTSPVLGISLPMMFLFALLGGLLLNLMPCVFPVLSLKAIAMLEAHEDPKVARHQAWFYTAGVIAFFLALAGLLLVLRAGGAKLGWGFQLQSPVFVGFLVVVFVVLGLNLLGVMEFGYSLTRLAGLDFGSGSHKAFFTGALATLVATPCTAPFMGAALGFALTQPAWVCLLSFVCLGLGMASPFLVLGHWPSSARFLPKPGRWMLRFKQLMSLPLFATAIWLATVLVAQVGGASKSNAADEFWQPWTPEIVESLRAEERGVFINFTADWCITCKVNERVVFAQQRVRDAFTKQKIVALKADWTDADPRIGDALAQFGRQSVPLYVFWPPAATEPEILPPVITADMVINALTQTKETQK